MRWQIHIVTWLIIVIAFAAGTASAAFAQDAGSGDVIDRVLGNASTASPDAVDRAVDNAMRSPDAVDRAVNDAAISPPDAVDRALGNADLRSPVAERPPDAVDRYLNNVWRRVGLVQPNPVPASGFSWSDAGIGAAIAVGGLLLLVASFAVFARGRVAHS